MNVQVKTLALRPVSTPTALFSAAVNLVMNWKLMELTAVVTVLFTALVSLILLHLLFQRYCFVHSFKKFFGLVHGSIRIAATHMIFPAKALTKYPEKLSGEGPQIVLKK